MPTLKNEAMPFIAVRDMPLEDRWVPELAREKILKSIPIAAPEPVVVRPQDPDLLNHYHHFQQMPHFIEAYNWEDYRPAYLYAINRFALAHQDQALFDQEFEADWMLDQGSSRLTSDQAKHVIRQVWDERLEKELAEQMSFASAP